MSDGNSRLGKPVDLMDDGFAYAYLAASLASRVTGGTAYGDGGAHIVV
jgi:enoyl-[acyl-carrier-protein] reductase (NADH)